MKTTVAEDLKLLQESLSGSRGDDQTRIAEHGLEWLTTILRKNADYGSSAWEAPLLAPQIPAGEAILVRMSDKIKRLLQLRENSPQVVDESVNDTMKDLGAYALLWLARPDPQSELREIARQTTEILNRPHKPRCTCGVTHGDTHAPNCDIWKGIRR